MFALILLFLGVASHAEGSLEPGSLSAAIEFWNSRHSAEESAILKHLSSAEFLNPGRNSFSAARAVVSLTASGRDLLSKLLPLTKAHELGWFPVSSPEAMDVPGLTPRTGGLYFKRQVFLDDTRPLVAFAASFFHEGIHAREFLVDPGATAKRDTLDRVYRTAARLRKLYDAEETITPDQKAEFASEKAEASKIIIHSECNAYRAENVFLKSLIEIDPSLQTFIESAVRDKRLIGFPITDRLIRDILTKNFDFPEEAVDLELEQDRSHG